MQSFHLCMKMQLGDAEFLANLDFIGIGQNIPVCLEYLWIEARIAIIFLGNLGKGISLHHFVILSCVPGRCRILLFVIRHRALPFEWNNE